MADAGATDTDDTPNSLVLRDADGGIGVDQVTLDGELVFTDPTIATIASTALGGPIMTVTYTNVGLGAYGNTNQGSLDVGVGLQTLGSATSASSYNSALGGQALLSETTGIQNVAVGAVSMFKEITGRNNVAVGMSALYADQNDDSNVAIGAVSFANLGMDGTSTNSGNIAIGFYAGISLEDGSNNIYLGNGGGASSESGVMRLGTINTQNTTFVAGIANSTVTGSAVYVSPEGQLGVASSSRRFKQDIHDMKDDSRVLLSMRPVSFRYKPEYDPSGAQQYGLIAEEVEQIAPQLVIHGEDGRPDSVAYNLVNAMLLNEFQRQEHWIENDETLLQHQQQRIEEQDALIATLTARVAQLEDDSAQKSVVQRQAQAIEALTARLNELEKRVH